MRGRVHIASAALALGLAACSDTATSPSGPAPSMVAGLVAGWSGGSASPTHFEVGRDVGIKRSGTASGYVRALVPSPVSGTFVALLQGVRAGDLRGKRVRLSGFLRGDSVGGDGGGLWMRVDGPNRMLSFDNMSGRRVLGTQDWREASVVLDVPTDAVGITFGILLAGGGTLRLDDARLDVVAASVPVTGPLNTDTTTTSSPVNVLSTYAAWPLTPENMDFEGIELVESRAATREWLAANSVPFATDDPAASQTDLLPLGAMVGSSRIIGMGEATHGTREFFRMKHRVFRYLVENHGFTTFGIEASWPEALDVDRFVRTGEGDPRLLVARMGFWTWTTDEVVDLVRWMRDYNQRAGAARLRFVGFDMQFPGAAIDSVESFVRRVDSASVLPVRAGHACLTPYRNTPQRRSTIPGYDALSESTRRACRDAVAAVRQLFTIHRAGWIAASSAPEFALAERSARLVQQWEEMAGAGSAGFAARDRAMAENAAWWLEQGGPSHRMMLWAHNAHVSARYLSMGAHLKDEYGPQYLTMAFAFGVGSFNAVTQLSTGAFAGLAQQSVAATVPGSLEALFASLSQPRLVFDARRLLTATDAAAPLKKRLTIREIGAAFMPTASTSAYQRSVVLPADYDLLLWFASTTASRVYSIAMNPAIRLVSTE
jgi:erythromycin esterase